MAEEDGGTQGHRRGTAPLSRAERRAGSGMEKVGEGW